MNAARLWWWSRCAHQRHLTPLARILRCVIFLAFNADLSYKTAIESDIVLWHKGLGVVIHPNVVIGRGVSIGHRVTIAGTDDGPPTVIGDRTVIAPHSMILLRKGVPPRIGSDVRIGGGSVVVGDVPDGAVVHGPRATYRIDD